MIDVILFLKLMAGHAVMDFWAQSDALAQMKNRNRPNTRVPPGQKPQIMWPYAMTAHASMHGVAVYFITGSMLLALIEASAHWVIDFGKFHVDQSLHAICKALYAI
jgi:hypothetical protein